MNKRTAKSRKIEVLLWSIALPGFGQLLNRQYVKGIILISLEILVNVMGNVNQVIVLSFHGDIQQAIEEANYLWIMFYPCLYFFAIWDAYKDAGGGESAYAFLPLVFSAYVVTIGLAISPIFTVFGHFIGPIWLPIIFTPIGLFIGWIIRWALTKTVV